MIRDLLDDLIVTYVESTGFIYSSKRTAHVENRPTWALLMKVSGETVYTCQNKTYLCNQNNVILAPRGCSYEYDSIVAGNFVWLAFGASQVHDQLIQIPVKNCQSLIDNIRKIESLRTNKPAMYHMACLAETYSLLLGLFKNITPKYVPSVNQRKIQPAMDYLVQNYTRLLTNDELAAQTEFSTSYFRKLFNDVYGTSPLAYQQTLRIGKAKEMLKSNTGSISEIAAALGYANIYDFSRAFKREVGVSPSDYAKRPHK